MNLKTSAVTLLSAGAFCATLFSAPISPDLKQNFSVEQPSRVPGATLDRGTYTLGVLDSLTDRAILQVKDSTGYAVSTFIGIRRPSAPASTHAGLNLWTNAAAGKPAYRVWVLPNGQGALEFAYPKADAVALAKVNGQPVPAIDPESEGKPADGSLSKDDMQVINLWLLSASTVNPQTGEAAIQAARFKVEGQLLAKATPAAQHLPHSASNLPLAGMGGAAMLFAGSLLLLRRKSVTGKTSGV